MLPPPPPPPASFVRTLSHFLIGGLFGGVLGVVFSALLFYVVLLGFLYAEQPIRGANQESIAVPHLNDFVLAPPLKPVDLAPPPGKQDQLLEWEHLARCFRQLRQEFDLDDVGWKLASWAIVAGLFGLVVGGAGALARTLFSRDWDVWFGILGLVAALLGLGIVFAHYQLQINVPFPLDAQGRLLIYAVVALVNLLWTSIAGARFRALLFTLVTVLAGEVFTLGLPPESVTTTSLWYSCLFLFVPSGYAWLVVERGESKQIIEC